VIDLDEGWRTERLDLEPLTVAHAAELAPLLDDTRLHEFTGGAPASAAALADRYARLAVRRSPGGDQLWGNWVLRLRGTGSVVGTVQATLPVGGPAAGPAEVAWVVAHAAQGRGYAKEAARSLVGRLHEAGWTVVAHPSPPRRLAAGRPRRGAGAHGGGPRRRGPLGPLTGRGARAAPGDPVAPIGSARRGGCSAGRVRWAGPGAVC
jgi:RimJ/RimL family protein N-acetyltransferase